MAGNFPPRRGSILLDPEVEARFRALEDSRNAQDERAEVLANAGVTTDGTGQGVASIPGPSGGGAINALSGDVTGPPGSTTVVKAQHTTLPVAVSPTDDEKFLRYQDATPAYELAFVAMAGDVSGTNPATVVDKAKGIPLPTPAAADDGEVLAYTHGTPAYVLRTLPFKAVAKAVDYTATLDDMVILVDATGAARTITLPTAASAKWNPFVVKKVDASANTVTLDGNGAETIDGAATQVLAAQWASLTCVSDGVAWFII